MVKNNNFKEQHLTQRWFIGDHGCVGGGNQSKAALSNVALQWMDEQFGRLGFPFRVDFSHLPDTNETDALARFDQDLAPIFLLEGRADRELRDGDYVDNSAKKRWESIQNYRPKTLEPSLGWSGLNREGRDSKSIPNDFSREG